MENNKYYALCSNEILKLISSLIIDDSNLNLLSNNYNNLFSELDTVNFIWPLVSTSLLMSENLYKYDKAYKLISDSTINLIVDKLYLYPFVQPGEETVSPCLLDSKNNVASSFFNYIKCDFAQEDYYNYYSNNEYLYDEGVDTSMMRSDLEETLENIRKDSSYGCNGSIIEDGYINVRKFIERTRNALAHSNYEVIDEDNIRLYHYNVTTKGMDFNVILEPSILVLIVDELNEIASKKYSYFMEFYHDYTMSNLIENELTDNNIIEYMLSFDMFDESVAKNILSEVKNKEEFLSPSNKEDKVIAINQTIYEKIRPVYDIGIILNDYLYCDEKGRIESDELYQKYDIFEYLNSNYYDTNEVGFNDNIYVQNKFKLLLLSLLNSSLLNGYNINEGKNIGIIDFSKMDVDEEIMKQFLVRNGVKTQCTIELLENEIEKNNKKVEEKSVLITKRQDILINNKIDNDYYNVVLPSQIKELKDEKKEINEVNILTKLEIEKAKEQGNMYNFDKNISQFIFNHLRNSLAHGYVKIPEDIDLTKVSDMIITFEDYDPDNKKELTFRGSIKVGDLLTIVTSNKYINNILGNNKSSVLVKK